MWIGRIYLFGWLSAYIPGFFMEPIFSPKLCCISRKEITSSIKIFTLWKIQCEKIHEKSFKLYTKKKIIMNSKVFEAQMNLWQEGVRALYKDLQEFHKWSDDKVWLEVETEMIKNAKGSFGSDDLDWVRAILTLKKDITLTEAKRMYERFKHETPLLDAIENLRIK